MTTGQPQIPEAPGTYGLVIALGGGSSMRVVASHVILPSRLPPVTRAGKRPVRIPCRALLVWNHRRDRRRCCCSEGSSVGSVIARFLTT